MNLDNLKKRAIAKNIYIGDLPITQVLRTLARTEKDNYYTGAMHDMSSILSVVYAYYSAESAIQTLDICYGSRRPLNAASISAIAYCNKLQVNICSRMWLYVLYICIRESRHFEQHSSSTPSDITGEGLSASDFIKVKNFFNVLYGCCPSHVIRIIEKRGQFLEGVSTKVFCNVLVRIFNDHCWAKSYGGRNWAYIAYTLYLFATGRMSALVFCDTAFTLTHNGGTIFNKGVYFGDCQEVTVKQCLNMQRHSDVLHPGIVGTPIYTANVHKQFKTHHLLLGEALKDTKYTLGTVLGSKKDPEEVNMDYFPTVTKENLFGYLPKYFSEDCLPLSNKPSEEYDSDDCNSSSGSSNDTIHIGLVDEVTVNGAEIRQGVGA